LVSLLRANRQGVSDPFAFNTSLQASLQADLLLIDHYDEVLRKMELSVKHHARHHSPQDLFLLRTIPGIGPILALNILYEIGDISRFERVQDFASYCRLIRPQKTSAGKVVAPSRGKIGNAHLKWTFSEAACGFPRKNDWGKAFVERLKRKHGNARALNVLCHKLGHAVYYMLKRKQAFDPERFAR
jgi:transposase